MKKSVIKMYVVLFAAFICLPRLFWMAFGKYADSGNYENRALAQKPAFHIRSYENYPREFEAFFNDTLPFRNELISLNSWMNYRIFRTSVNENVVIGKDKWLFYDAFSDGDPMGDYEGNHTFSDEELERMGDACLNVQNRLGETGIELAIIIPPNKERVYGRFMPERYTASETSRTDRMIERLEAGGVPIINPKDALLERQEEYELYYPYDTHWNQLGGYVGTCTVLNSWGIETMDLDELTVLPSRRSNDDLANMLNLGDSVFNDGTEYTIQGEYDREGVQIADGLVHLKNPSAACDKTVFLLGDSYRTAMRAALCLYFTDVYVAEYDRYAWSMIEEARPDYLIVEYVERNSARLAGIEELVFRQGEESP